MENGEPAEEGGPEAVFYRLVWLNLYDTCSSMLAGKRSWGKESEGLFCRMPDRRTIGRE